MLCAATITNAQEKNNVTFKLENGGADTVLIGYTSESDKALDEFIDTAVLKNGMLQYNMKFKGFIRGVIIPFSLMERFKSGVRLPAGRIEFYMNEGDEMVIDARNSPQGLKYTVTGNTISQQMAHYNNLYAQRSQEAMDRDRAYYDIKASERTPEINEAYLANRRKMNLVRENRTLQYARSNPGLEYTARQLLSVSNKDSVLSVFPLLTQNVRDSFFGKILTGMVNGWFTSVEGKQLPDFEAVTITGQKFKLSAQKAKFVLLDFWGSWCTPCLAEAPEMRALATEYKDKLQIVGLIANDTKEKASAAIKRHQLDWIQLYSDKNLFGVQFGIRGYPHKILLNDKGVVLKVITGTSDQVFKELRTLIGS